jgi:hypothetical protein
VPKEILKRGATSNIIRVFLQDSASTTGAGKTALTNTSSGLIISTIADLEATATTYTSSATNVETITTLGTFAAPTASKCRFREVDATNFPGVYEIHIADARFAVANSTQLLISIQCTGVAPVYVEYQLVVVDLMNGVHFGLTALPNTAVTTNGSLITSGTGTAQLSVTSGNVSVGTIATNAITAASITDGVIASEVWNALLADYTTVNTFGARVVRTIASPVTNEVSINASNHLAANVHQMQNNTITAAAIATDAIDADALSTDASNEIADALLNRNIGGGSSAGRLVKEALYALRNKTSITGTLLTVCDENDNVLLPAWTANLTISASADPITGIDPV